MPNRNNKKKLSDDIPPRTTLCIVTATIGEIIALQANASIEVKASLAALLAALAYYVKRTGS